MELYQAIRLRALRSVIKPDGNYFVRKVLRWYSRTFFTPLREVEEMPLEDVFQAYWEERYEGLSEEDREAERQELLVSQDERYQRVLAEEAEEAELFEMAKIVAAEEAAKKRARADKSQVSKSSDQPMVQALHKPLGLISRKEMPESDLPGGPGSKPTKIPEGITVTFMDDADLEAELDGFGTMSQPERKP